MLSLVIMMALAADPKPEFNPVGTWEGALDLGVMKMRLVFKVQRGDKSDLKATMDSVDQGAKDIPVDIVKVEDGEFKLELTKIGAIFAGKTSEDGKSATGKWKQSGQEYDLVLKRVDKPTELLRPQNPTKPYPYIEEEVTFENPAAKDVKIAGTLTLPKGNGPFPAVVMITGSGPQDRDEAIMGHKPFLVIADYLTRKGIAVLRCDDRGVGKSTGTQKGATSADFATDAFAGVKYLQGRKEIDGKRIGLAGHSEGGLIAPMVAADHPDDVGFIVLLAGPGLPGNEVLIYQSAALLRAMKTEPAELAVMGKLQSAVMKAAHDIDDEGKFKEAIEAAINNLSDDEKKALDPAVRKATEDSYKKISQPWMRYFLRFDPRPTLKKVRCPVLAINGELDLQVTPKENLPALAAALKEGGNTSVTIKEFPGLNHLFQHCKTGMPTEYGEIEETFSPEAMELIATWVLKLKS